MQINQAQLNAAIETAKAKAAGNAKWTRAVERAAAGLQSGELIVTLLAHDALVTSANGSYRVNGSCQCEAARRGHRECKHRAAVRIVEMMGTETAPAAKSFNSPSRSIDRFEKVARAPRLVRSVESDRIGVKYNVVRIDGWAI